MLIEASSSSRKVAPRTGDAGRFEVDRAGVEQHRRVDFATAVAALSGHDGRPVRDRDRLREVVQPGRKVVLAARVEVDRHVVAPGKDHLTRRRSDREPAGVEHRPVVRGDAGQHRVRPRGRRGDTGADSLGPFEIRALERVRVVDTVDVAARREIRLDERIVTGDRTDAVRVARPGQPRADDHSRGPARFIADEHVDTRGTRRHRRAVDIATADEDVAFDDLQGLARQVLRAGDRRERPVAHRGHECERVASPHGSSCCSAPPQVRSNR